ncbi:uncharacterized protein Z518_07792 [Rhinocladiella mackenziei CBS 650.93]|uniref:Rhinocladiella mackenziei CBS 650.93 unplaced genomic scaffold supercont1.5, whole genome shotgun sequence n=1 Tax=Rhinocladiella mackenziei CBS 650.93 TaxID=1442369 RepID=A0A0D2H1A8_9EURO|nr:uncharacterized protein Z518_07792 [Rhinocladiella mackenziei CBS 650.93]KIX04238.1 hypothetical protein Z518_07792 [Rhinocladiella mackenziei CBS 650.93]
MLTSMEIGALRTLLPEKLINPTRFVLDNPDDYKPEKLAAYLQSAAQAGSRDVERFKKDWHSDDVRDLWQAVNTNDLPQGGDAWALDYGALLQHAGSNEQPSTTGSGSGPQVQPPSKAETAKTVKDFQVRHPALKLHVPDEANPLPLEITVAELEFCVDRDRSPGATGYTVTGKPGSEALANLAVILQAIQDSNAKASLATLLDQLAAYDDIRSRPCDKCNRLIDGKKLQLPYIRQLKTATGDEPARFIALHHDCA